MNRYRKIRLGIWLSRLGVIPKFVLIFIAVAIVALYVGILATFVTNGYIFIPGFMFVSMIVFEIVLLIEVLP